MTFSPEDAYASNMPVPDDNQFDTGGLELAPLEGESTNPLSGYTEEEQAADAERYSVESGIASPDVSAETVIENPYNLATEAIGVDSDGLEQHIDSFNTDQREALSTILPQYAADLNRMGNSLDYKDRLSDYKVMELGVTTLKEKMSGFQGDETGFNEIKQSYLAMRKAFPGFNLGEEITVTYYRGDGLPSTTTFR